jgi:hypothetical protein
MNGRPRRGGMASANRVSEEIDDEMGAQSN